MRQFKKCLDRERDLYKSVSGSVKVSTCRMCDELFFIRDTISNRVISSNLTLPNSQQSSSQSQSPISSAPISISPPLSPINTAPISISPPLSPINTHQSRTMMTQKIYKCHWKSRNMVIPPKPIRNTVIPPKPIMIKQKYRHTP